MTTNKAGFEWQAAISRENIELYKREGVVVVKVPELVAVSKKRASEASLGACHGQAYGALRAGGLFVAAPDPSDKVDFIGTTGTGQGVAFEAKSIRAEDTSINVYSAEGGLTLRQRNTLATFAKAGAIAFIYVEWRRDGSRWVLPVDERGHVAGAEFGKRKSFPLSTADPKYRVPPGDTWLDHFRTIYA